MARSLFIACLLQTVSSSTTLAFGVLQRPIVNGAGPMSRQSRTVSRSYATPLDDMYFQIEEMEDRDSCTTEVMLRRDETVGLLQTNGPPFVTGTGKWRLKPDGTFQMTLHRTYESGQERKLASDMGVFTFVTERSFVGQLQKVGAKQGIEGAMLDGDWYATERKVGFFEMIDTTVDADGEVSLRGGVRSS